MYKSMYAQMYHIRYMYYLCCLKSVKLFAFMLFSYNVHKKLGLTKKILKTTFNITNSH